MIASLLFCLVGLTILHVAFSQTSEMILSNIWSPTNISWPDRPACITQLANNLFSTVTQGVCISLFMGGINNIHGGVYYISLTSSIMGDPNISVSNATSVFDNISLYHLPSLSFGGDILCSANSSGILHGNLYLHQLHSKLFGEYVYHSCTARVHNQTALSYGNISCTTKLRLSMGSR